MAITATRIDLILASCVAAAADMSVAPLATDHRLVSATFGKLTAFCKRSLLWRMHPSVLADDEACAAVCILLESNCVLVDYAAWSSWPKLKLEVANKLKKAAINAARARNDALAPAKQELARATTAVFASASPMNLRAATEAGARAHACHVVRLHEDACSFEASAFASVARLQAMQRTRGSYTNPCKARRSRTLPPSRSATRGIFRSYWLRSPLMIYLTTSLLIVLSARFRRGSKGGGRLAFHSPRAT